MKKNTLLLLFLCFSVSIFAQKEKPISYDRIDKYVMNLSKSKTKSIDTLAFYLNAGTHNSRERARAIYDWITLNIKYDNALLDSLTTPWVSKEILAAQSAENVLYNKRGVCEGYANLFNALAERMSLRSEMVSGAVKQNDGQVPRVGHAWNAVKIAQEWQLIDATWGANDKQKIDETYFFPSPEFLIINHLPFDPMWQLTPNPLTFEIFKNASDKEVVKIFNKNPKNNFEFKDTILRYFRQDTLMRLLKSSDRMLRFNPDNEYVTFEVGKANYFRYMQLSQKLEDKLFIAFVENSVNMDSLRFEKKLAAKWLYYQKTLDCYKKIPDENVQKQVEKGTYTKRQIEGLQKIERGLYMTTVFRNVEASNSVSLEILKKLENWYDQSNLLFRESLTCFDTLINTKFKQQKIKSLYLKNDMKLSLCKSYLHYAVRFMDDADILKNKNKMKSALSLARGHYINGLSLARQYESADSTQKMEIKYKEFEYLLEIEEIIADYNLYVREADLKKDGMTLSELMKNAQILIPLAEKNQMLLDKIQAEKNIFIQFGYQETIVSSLLHIKTALSQCIYYQSDFDNKITTAERRVFLEKGEKIILESENLLDTSGVIDKKSVDYSNIKKSIEEHKKRIKEIRIRLKL